MDEIKVNLENLTDEECKILMDLVEKSNEKEVGNWKPKKNEKYWSVYLSGASYVRWDEDRVDNFLYATCNCFKTKKKAEFHREEMLVESEIKRIAKEYNEGWIPNWSDHNENKYCIVFNASDGVYCALCSWASGLPNDMYFKSNKLCNNAIEVIGKDRLKKYWFKVES